MRAGAVPQAPQFRPPTQVAAAASANNGTKPKDENVGRKSDTELKREVQQKTETKTEEKKAGDPLGDARNKVQEEISNEFAAIMATGTLRASEAAALATRRVMQKHGHMYTAQSSS